MTALCIYFAAGGLIADGLCAIRGKTFGVGLLFAGVALFVAGLAL